MLTAFCVNRLSGDTESLWKVDKLRSETYTQHTLSAAFSCAKVKTFLSSLLMLGALFMFALSLSLTGFSART